MLTIEIERLDLRPGDRVLDLGCGDGRHTRYLRLLEGVTSVALDLGREEVERTHGTLTFMDALKPEEGGPAPGAGPWLVVRGDGYHLPFGDDTFDCIIISEVLEHLHDDDAALRELSRVLKPGGTLGVSVPREGPETVCWALSQDYHNVPGGHVRIYRRSALRAKLAAHGYSITDCHFAHALHSPFWWLKCAFGPNRSRDPLPVRLYHKLLVWDLMKAPWLTRRLEKMLNPLIGKSVVMYATKG
ncbi:MAG: class I SAM-dependent methyltransferase [Candidatus Binatia bacterium]